MKLHEGVEGQVATVHIRYVDPDRGHVNEASREFMRNELSTPLEEASPRLQLDAVVAEYAEVLRNSYWAQGSTFAEVRTVAERVRALLPNDPDVDELVDLVSRAEAIAAAPTATPCPTDVHLLGRDLSSSSGVYSFFPGDITVCAGDTVTFTFTSETQFHTLTVEALGIDVNVSAGTSQRFAYTFDRTGAFELICIPHQALGMTGTITVKQRP